MAPSGRGRGHERLGLAPAARPGGGRVAKEEAVATDPRLATVYNLIDDLDTAGDPGQLNEVIQNVVLARVDWSTVDVAIIKAIFDMLWINSADGRHPNLKLVAANDDLRREAIMKAVIGEHMLSCACCRREVRS
jgi:hypothetical protein